MPLEEQVWGDEFGQLTDKFGIDWMVNIGGGAEAGDVTDRGPAALPKA